MGWTGGTHIFPVKISKNTIKSEIYESHYQERGAMEPVFLDFKWMENKVCDNYEDAKEYINSLNLYRKFNVAVKFKNPLTEPKETSSMKTLLRRIAETEEKLIQYEKNHSVTTFKAEYIGCPDCGSKLKRELLKTDKCPLCGTDMRSKTTTETLSGYRIKIKELKKQYNTEYKKALEKVKTEICWLVEAETYLG